MNKQQWDGVMASKDDMVAKYQDSYDGTAWAEGVWWLIWEFFGWSYCAQLGAELQGYSFSQRGREWLLCVKVVVDGTPQVGFMTDATTTGCVKRLLYKLETGTLVFYPDRYA